MAFKICKNNFKISKNEIFYMANVWKLNKIV